MLFDFKINKCQIWFQTDNKRLVKPWASRTGQRNTFDIAPLTMKSIRTWIQNGKVGHNANGAQTAYQQSSLYSVSRIHFGLKKNALIEAARVSGLGDRDKLPSSFTSTPIQ